MKSRGVVDYHTGYTIVSVKQTKCNKTLTQNNNKTTRFGPSRIKFRTPGVTVKYPYFTKPKLNEKTKMNHYYDGCRVNILIIKKKQNKRILHYA